MRNAPAFTDGVLTLWKTEQSTVGDYPKTLLKPHGNAVIWFREKSIFDRTRIALEEAGKRITRKVQIPEYRDVCTHDFVLIEDKFSEVFNVAHCTDRVGFPVTELTLIEPENNRLEVAE